MGIDLPVVWAVIIAFGLMMYVIMDGFDLGIGILFPFVRDREDRDIMVNTVAPVWDGNETWLVLGGAALMAAFPLAYAIILSALYLPLVLMLLGLIWRGVAFEFRFKADEHHKPFWDHRLHPAAPMSPPSSRACRSAPSSTASRCRTAAFAGGALDWLTPFSLFTGLGLIVAYALLGSTWLIIKTEGALQDRMVALARPITVALIAVIGIVSLWTPLAHPAIAQRWFSFPNIVLFSPVPVLVLVCGWAHPAQPANRRPRRSVPACAVPAVPRLQRARHQPVALHHPARHHHPRGRRPAPEHGLHAGRRAVHHPLHPRLHGVVLLCLPRQGEGRRGLSLMAVPPRAGFLAEAHRLAGADLGSERGSPRRRRLALPVPDGPGRPDRLTR